MSDPRSLQMEPDIQTDYSLTEVTKVHTQHTQNKTLIVRVAPNLQQEGHKVVLHSYCSLLCIMYINHALGLASNYKNTEE